MAGDKVDKKKKKKAEKRTSEGSETVPAKKARKSAEKEAKSMQASDVSFTKKGKARESSTSTSALPSKDGKITLQTASRDSPYAVGAVLVSAADFDPPRDISYTLHHLPSATASTSSQQKKSSDGTRYPTLEDGMIFSGETDTMDIVGWNWELHPGNDHATTALRRDAKGYSGEYLVGVYDPDRQSVTLRVAPMFTLRRSVKALNSLSLGTNVNGLGDWQARVAARRGLGEAFGNRKTKAKARAEDRMKVDTSNMFDVMNSLQDEIEDNKPDTLSIDQINAQAQQSRPIPPPNLHALTPQEAYPLDVLIPDAVFRLLSTRSLEQVTSQEQLGRALPVRAAQSSWLMERMWSLVQSAQLRSHKAKANGKVKKDFDDEEGIDDADERSTTSNGILKTSRQDARTKLKVAMYVSFMWGFIALVGSSRNSGGEWSALLSRMKLDALPGGESILTDLFARFAVMQRGAERGSVTTFTETKLYSYMFALCLYLDDYRIDPIPLARDLSMPPTKVKELFRSLGCTSSDKSVAGPSGTSRMQRRIILKCPIELPQPRKGRRAAA